MTTLSCVGAGRLGRTLCRLLSEHVTIQQVINSRQPSARQAVDFIGAGTAATMDSAKPADLWLIATPDNQIEAAYQALLASGAIETGKVNKSTVVFHCSGSMSASILSSAEDNIVVASVHPIHSFANPQQSLHTFVGSHCAIEGQPDAVAMLQPLFESIGALPFAIDSQHKALYHGATVMACNYLVSLLETSQQMLTAAGVDNSHGNILQSLIRQTLDNYLSTDATAALTGPIARGDTETVASHLRAFNNHEQADLWHQLYTALGNATLPIAAQQGQASDQHLQQIKQLLKSSHKKN